MITIARCMLRQLRAVLVNAGIGKDPGSWGTRVWMHADADGLRVRAMSAYVAVEYFQPATDHGTGYTAAHGEPVVVPLELLAAWEGDSQELVSLESKAEGEILVHWGDGNWPQTIQHIDPFSEALQGFPGVPDEFITNRPAIFEALRQASLTADQERLRFAVNTIQLRGSTGMLVATDSRQALWQSGFQFPWRGDLLVHSSNIFGSIELPVDERVNVGQVDGWVVIRIARWTFWLHVDQVGTFPPVDELIPPSHVPASHARLSASDVAFALLHLPQLPWEDGDGRSLTVEFDRQVRLRARSHRQARTTELVLNNSWCSGPALTFQTNRDLLARALRLGFRRFRLVGSRLPVVCDDGLRRYVWALLDPRHVVPRSLHSVRIESPLDSLAANVHTPETSDASDGSEDNTDGANVASAVPMRAIEWDGLAHLESLLRDAMAQTRRLREQSEEPRVRV